MIVFFGGPGWFGVRRATREDVVAGLNARHLISIANGQRIADDELARLVSPGGKPS